MFGIRDDEFERWATRCCDCGKLMDLPSEMNCYGQCKNCAPRPPADIDNMKDMYSNIDGMHGEDLIMENEDTSIRRRAKDRKKL